jgi:hypothetical protein
VLKAKFHLNHEEPAAALSAFERARQSDPSIPWLAAKIAELRRMVRAGPGGSDGDRTGAR